jgi:hypothetical protein
MPCETLVRHRKMGCWEGWGPRAAESTSRALGNAGSCAIILWCDDRSSQYNIKYFQYFQYFQPLPYDTLCFHYENIEHFENKSFIWWFYLKIYKKYIIYNLKCLENNSFIFIMFVHVLCMGTVMAENIG